MQALLQAIKEYFQRKYRTGVVIDSRPPEAKQCDYLHEERVPAPQLDAFSNNRIQTSPYFYENQHQTSSCVPHGVLLALAIERVKDGGDLARLSQMFVYKHRSNFPGEGAWMQEVFNIIRKYGAPLFYSLPTPETEKEANAVNITQQLYTEAEIYKGDEYYALENPKDFEEIALIAQQGHGVPIVIYSRWAEWAVEMPFVQSFLNLIGAPINHCVCVLPKSGHWYEGQRYITIQDSAWFGGIKLRHLSEAFIKNRCYSAAYWDTVKFIGSGERPKHTFTKVLKFGDESMEVKQMQILLVAEGLLPVGLTTGYFGGRTLAGVRAFQNKYASEILVSLGLNAPTSTWGSACIAKANKLCYQS